MKTQDEILQEISRKLGEITPQVETLSQAKQAGMTMTGQTTVEEAERFLSSPRIQDPDTTNESALSILDKITPESRLAELELQRQKDTERLQSEIAEAKEERRTWTERASDFLTGRKAQPIIEEKQEEFKVKEYMDTASASLSQALELQRKAINLEAQKEGALAAVAASGITTPYLSKEQARIAEAYDRRISSLAALAGAESAYAQAVQGQISQARALIGDIVNAYTYDTNLELQRINMFIELNSAELAELGAEYQNALNESQRYWENKLAEEKNERTNVLELMLSYAGAGITINDTQEEAVQKASAWAGTQPDTRVLELMMKYGGAGILPTDTLTQAAIKVAALPQEVGGLDPSDYFSPEQERELRREGIDPNSIEGLMEGISYFKKGKLTGATLEKMEIMGLPRIIANDIHDALADGYSLHQIYEDMKDAGIPPEEAGKFIEVYKDGIKQSGGVLYLPSGYEVEEQTNFMTLGKVDQTKEDEVKLRQELEAIKGESEKTSVWYKPWTWGK